MSISARILGEAGPPKELSPLMAYGYARKSGHRWPEAEPLIASTAESAYRYAKDIVKERFPEGEPAIAKSAEYSVLYAVDVVKGRFIQGEKAVFNVDFTREVYLEKFQDAKDDWMANGWIDWMDV